MEKDQLSRKLAVILHADVVGSTALVQIDETIAHKRIQNVFNTFSETIERYGGIAHEIRGDAIVAEFERTSDAVIAAIAFQAINEELNESIDDDIRPQLRVGISLGEVIVADNTITGAGVVLAQRLEQLADPGGVVVQGAVSETIPSRMPFEFESLGEQVLKGFDQPVRAFSVRPQPGEDLPAPEVNSATQNTETSKFQGPAKLSSESYEALTGKRLELPDKPSIAVLPFQNMSGDPDQDFFADGMSEDIITTLSRVPDLIVIARSSTFAYKGRDVDIRQTGQDLGVRHVLEGSIRKSGDRLRITARLVDTQNGDHLWAERYDRNLDDIFVIQDEITHQIVIELHDKLVSGEFARLVAIGTNSVEAWELTRRCAPLIESIVRDDAIVAKQLLERALELDSNYSAAWTFLGWVYWAESVWGWSSDIEKSMQLAIDTAQKAISIDAQYPDAYSLFGNICMSNGDTEQAIEMCEKAVELAPSDSLALAHLADVLVESGRVAEGIKTMQRAIRLCPFPPAWYLMLLGAGFHLNDDSELACSALELAIERQPDSHLPRVWLASTLVELGRLEEARAISKAVLDIEPDFLAVSWAESFNSDSHARLKDNLLTAGFPE